MIEVERWFSVFLALVIVGIAFAWDRLSVGAFVPPGRLTNVAGDIAAVSLLSGVSAFATIEVLKRTTSIRGLMQRWFVQTWSYRSGHRYEVRDLVADLRFTSYDLPVEQLAAQIAAAAELTAMRRRSQEDDSSRHGDAFFQAQTLRVVIDDLQLDVGRRWRRFVQATALWLNGLYGLLYSGRATEVYGSRLLYTVAAIGVGGTAAWVIRDVTAAIERRRV